MRKIFLFLIAAAVVVLCSCTQDVLYNSTGTVTFEAALSRGVTASIDWPSLTDKVWNLTATKTDGGEATGQGTYEELVLADSIGPFSVGTWEFTVTDTTGSWTGTVTKVITAGSNTVAFDICSTAAKGTLSVENCNFLVSKIGTEVSRVDCYVDDSKISKSDWLISPDMTEDGDYYVLPTLTSQLAGGVHTIRLFYNTNNGGTSSETFSFRVVNGMTTHITIGEQEGNASFTVAFAIVEALVV